ncbi:serum response factor-like [Montipora capricornis]|uniref:serum response factor-like n=1 Tax=Montipora foliosa TaxID=591990 RepID=UPI0035F1690F
MQSEESTTTSVTLDTMQYASQAQGSGVLDPTTIEQGAFEAAMDHPDEHGMKRQADSDDGGGGEVVEDRPKKKTRGRVKIEMKFIESKLRRYTTFSKRKTGIMKKAYELSTLTGTQVMLLVASETGHVYTFATRKLQPMITSESGKALIQTCLNSPDPPVSQIPNPDQRMSATGYEETDLTYTVNENEGDKMQDRGAIYTTQQIDGSQGLAVGALSGTSGPMTGITALPAAGHSFPITTYIPPSNIQQQGGNKNPSVQSSYSVQAMPGGAFTTIFAPGTSVQLGQPLTQGQQQGSTVQVLSQPVQIQRVQPQTQTVQVNAVNPTTTSNTITLQMGQESNQTHEHNVDQSSGSQGNNLQSVGTVVLPIATNQDGSVVSLGNVVPSSMMLTSQAGQIPVMYSVYASPSSGLVTVSNLSEGGGDHSSNHTHHLQGEANDMGQQSLPGSLSLATVQVHQDMNSAVHTYSTQGVVTETSATQTAEDMHIDHTSLDSESGIGKNDLSVSQTEV